MRTPIPLGKWGDERTGEARNTEAVKSRGEPQGDEEGDEVR